MKLIPPSINNKLHLPASFGFNIQEYYLEKWTYSNCTDLISLELSTIQYNISNYTGKTLIVEFLPYNQVNIVQSNKIKPEDANTIISSYFIHEDIIYCHLLSYYNFIKSISTYQTYLNLEIIFKDTKNNFIEYLRKFFILKDEQLII